MTVSRLKKTKEVKTNTMDNLGLDSSLQKYKA